MNKKQAVKSLEKKVLHDFSQLRDIKVTREQPYSQQTHHQSEYQTQQHLSEYQNFLYKRAMFGLKMYTEDEIKLMHWEKRKRVKKVFARTQTELNTWKQSRIISLTNKIFELFHHSETANDIVELYSEPDPKFTCRTAFKDLDINKEDIINRLLEKGILPHNFREVKEI